LKRPKRAKRFLTVNWGDPLALPGKRKGDCSGKEEKRSEEEFRRKNTGWQKDGRHLNTPCAKKKKPEVDSRGEKERRDSSSRPPGGGVKMAGKG